MSAEEAPPMSSIPRPPRLAGRQNPVFLRELRQSARLLRTPFILMTVTAVTAFVLSAVGGIMMTSKVGPAEVGRALHHTFFSIAYFVVSLAGPTVSANSIAQEREGRTWEALMLTGLSPSVIARGKFTSAYTSVAMFIVSLAPVGALPFLFGGVTAIEVVLAFVCLFVGAALWVAFGLAVSSKMENLRAAIVVTLLVAVVTAPVIYGVGISLTFAAHKLWPAVPEGWPVWLPSAYERAPFGWDYVGYLLVAPLLAAALPAWFFYEVTLANLTSVTDDRSTGIRRWFLVSATVLALGAAATTVGSGLASVSAVMLSLYAWFLVLGTFTFAGEPIGPSRRVLARWEREGAGAVDRALGPGVMRATTTSLVIGLGGVSVITAAGLAVGALGGSATKAMDSLALMVVATYTAGFFVFLAGFTAWLRARTNSVMTPRILLLVTLGLVLIGPWLAAAIGGAMSGGVGHAPLLAAPSPIYALVVAAEVGGRSAMPDVTAVIVASVAAGAWAVAGLVALVAAARRCDAVIKAYDEALSRGDALLAEEDAKAAADVAEMDANATGEADATRSPS